jgi:hypothetical protein
MRMARATFARDTGKLRFGNADRLSIDRPVNRHSLPLVRIRVKAKPYPGGPNASQ